MQINPVRTIPPDILRSILILYLYLRVRLWSDHFFSLPHKRRVYILFFPNTCHILCLAHPPEMVTSMKLLVMQVSQVTFSLPGQNSFLSTQFSIALSIRSTDQFSHPSENNALRETLLPCRGSPAGFGCKRRPPDKKGSCECIEKILTDSRQRSVLQLGSLARH